MAYRNQTDPSPYRYDHDGDPDGPAVARPELSQRNFVVPVAPQRATGDVTPAWLVERQPLSIEPVLTPIVTSMEQSGPVARAKALQLRMTTLLVLYAVLAVVVAGAIWLVADALPWGAMAGALVFSALGSYTYLRMNWQDYAHSAHGTERHRIDTAADLAKTRMDHEHELRKAALAAYLRTLENHDADKRR